MPLYIYIHQAIPTNNPKYISSSSSSMEMESCDTSLGLGIGNRNLSFDRQQERQQRRRRQSPPVQFDLLFPHHMNGVDEERDGDGSSSKTVDDEDDRDKSVRKKLKLTKEQSSLLENIFKEYNTPSLTQKQELAKQLNLQPRQVEVWFQNRRARTKVKQTEVDFEFLKKCCEKLSEENQRLKKELHELRSVNVGESQFLVQLPKGVSTTMIMCPAHCSPRREDSEIRIL